MDAPISIIAAEDLRAGDFVYIAEDDESSHLYVWRYRMSEPSRINGCVMENYAKGDAVEVATGTGDGTIIFFPGNVPPLFSSQG